MTISKETIELVHPSRDKSKESIAAHAELQEKFNMITEKQFKQLLGFYESNKDRICSIENKAKGQYVMEDVKGKKQEVFTKTWASREFAGQWEFLKRIKNMKFEDFKQFICEEFERIKEETKETETPENHGEIKIITEVIIYLSNVDPEKVSEKAA